ncbi:hypothetical protein [Mucilaginibacter psychrotolerans]|uniref:Uncharacterized protein n=1 Tax=Mucilaginibacter psychrotolerans TaxID=1524096 RepID=A0A4Y8SC78_9SPHI|nr:hypothetical protein [Mucilaginibacter psychrotolerans]TFF36197.1 hypothetical protein E2R66_16790 [Mucilaginibacter psychrotolerans]
MATSLAFKLESNAVLLQKIIAAYTPYSYQSIDLDQEIEDVYIAKEFKLNFCHDILNTWKQIDGAALINDMFEDLKTGNDILKIVKYIQ